jgi:hypothetical protein
MNAMPVPPPPMIPEPVPEPLSQGSRIVNTIIAPTKTFDDLRRSASWWAPWVLMAIISLLFSATMARYVGFEQISKNQIARSSRADQFEKLPASQQAQQIRISVLITRYISYAYPLLMLLIFVIMAAVLMGTFNLAAGAAVKFKVALAIVIYSSLPGILGALLGIVSVLVGGMTGTLDREAFNITNPVATNVAYFMDPGGNRFLYALLTGVDVFVIWTITLMGIGFACNSKVKRGTAIWIVVGWFLVAKLIGAILAALG